MKFLDLKSKQDFCSLFEIPQIELDYLLSTINFHYRTFSIKKKNGTKRVIDAPDSSLIQIQKRLCEEILKVYKPKKAVHAFCVDRNIKTNALRHRKPQFLLNVDLKDFFHTITYNRVLGLFKAFPFNFNEEISQILTTLSCFKFRLPQGSPVSPILSNLICRTLDTQLTKLCEELKCHYTRYADDISISTRINRFPKYFGEVSNGGFILSDNMLKILKKNNFQLNKEKIRFQESESRQVVTGLTVNKKVNVNRMYIKKVRAILHSIEKFGVEKAMLQHFSINGINVTGKDNSKTINYFLKRVVGKISFIGFIRGKDDPLYIKLFTRIKKIEPNAKLSIVINSIKNSDKTLIVTEGKTDWKHLKAAYRYFVNKGKYHALDFSFHEYENEIEMGSDSLLKFCQQHSKGIIKLKHKVICVFDRDERKILANATVLNNSFKDWGNNVYSLVIPAPSFRNHHEISIEQLYLDNEITQFDKENRRVYFSNEFDPVTGRLKTNFNIAFKKDKKNPLHSIHPKIIDYNVFEGDKSISLSKNKFAEYILERIKPFDKMTFSEFEPFFVTISKIIDL